MKVELNKVFEINGSVENTWVFLQNISSVASCMPGAEITEQVDDNNYKGKVKANIGPVTMAFNGDIKIIKIDPRYFRPTEVETLLGDPSKAKEKLGWEPKITFEEMVHEMMENDINIAKRDSLIQHHGFKAQDFHE